MKPILVEFFLKRKADKLFRRIAKFLRIGGGQFWAWTFPVMLQVTQILFADAELLRECRHGHLFRLTDCRKQMTKPELRARDFFKRFERALRHCALIVMLVDLNDFDTLDILMFINGVNGSIGAAQTNRALALTLAF